MITRRGFTLIELTVVLVIMALLSTVVGLSLASVSRQTTLREAVAAITDLDRSMRMECVDYNRKGELRFDPDRGDILLSIKRDEEDVAVQAYQLPVGMKIVQVQVAGDQRTGSRGGLATIPCDVLGKSPTYGFALAIESANTVDWVELVVAGLTGQVQEIQDDSEVKDLFAVLASGHAD